VEIRASVSPLKRSSSRLQTAWVYCLSATFNTGRSAMLMVVCQPHCYVTVRIFLCYPVLVRCVDVSAWGRMPPTIDAGGRGGWPNFETVVSFRWVRWAACRERVAWPNSFPGGGICTPIRTCGRRRRALPAGVKRLMNRGYLCRALSGRFSDLKWDFRSEIGTAEIGVAGGGFANVACFDIRTAW